jgi:hypothetical protein
MMHLSTLLILSLVLFQLGCKPKSTEFISRPNQVIDIQFEPILDNDKTGWIKMTIDMELDNSNPLYPIGVKQNHKTESLRLTLYQTVKAETTYSAEFHYYSSEESEPMTLNMDDFEWSPYINFSKIELPQIQQLQ